MVEAYNDIGESGFAQHREFDDVVPSSSCLSWLKKKRKIVWKRHKGVESVKNRVLGIL